jgi:hypothetical protein
MKSFVVVSIFVVVVLRSVLPTNNDVFVVAWTLTARSSVWTNTSPQQPYHRQQRTKVFPFSSESAAAASNLSLWKTSLSLQNYNRQDHRYYHHQRNRHVESSRHHVDVSIRNQTTSSNRRSFIQLGVSISSAIVLNTIVTASSVSYGTKSNMVVHAAMQIDTTALRPATEDQPQIPFPDRNAMKDFESPPTTLEGTFLLRNDKI